MTKRIKLNDDIIFGDPESPPVLLAGPCSLESRELAMTTASRMKEIAERLNFPYVFKSSYDKANRSSIDSFRGPGLDRGLRILADIKEKFSLPVLSDIHSPEQAEIAGEVLDIVQVPAFLSRQTDLVLAAGETQKIVNVKKGQFLAPWDIEQVVEKIESTGNHKIILTERGAIFGYNNLVVDMRSLVRMQETGYPVVFDATHSVQLPGGQGDRSGGEREYVRPLARAAAGVGIQSLFVETHPEPSQALCDGPNMVPLDNMEELLKEVKELDMISRRGGER
ncbi:3-deoxy-8-phosphooctulonate synthase [Halarsenatibacter silvermanii]|uniref:2-dehydro-3-deoxyphosphooctonate aldolase n=1 Tax=Halarsenatibacter silvermanii TaxID=321763 RepID=A0A1G9I0M6_9FIRM|nr:3-deoxy-8-phosphooctulonate synthase [Halarsenatibacter silvermanii]SDL18759.1 2-dehydro-3-deoxyphosphooctonate aldolase (KDO 8-P synthase) [Halarsenatibacter silvermanii]